jgi:flagellar motor switch protein FliN/FliY
VTTTLANPLFQRIGTAASGAVALLPAGEPLVAADPVDGAPADLSLPTAVIAPFQGSASGELALLVDGDVVTALQAGPAGAGDVTAALRPALEAVAAGLQIAIGDPQTLAGPMAVRRLSALDQVATVVLRGAAGTRAAVVLGTAASAAFTPTGPAASRPPAGRLDLLRGVEMQATVELGRARLTLNDLLGLRDGAVIELDRAAGDAADLSVNGRLIARGEIVVVDENYALRITEIVAGEGA